MPENRSIINEEAENIELEFNTKRKSQFRDIVKRYMQNKKAVVCMAVIILLVICAVLAPVLAPYGYDDQELSKQFLTPSREHLFGTDEYGRDIFSRILYGSRYSLSVGLISVSISCIAGTILGCISGFYGKTLDNIIMRFVDILLAIPNILLAISITAALGPGLTNLMIAVGISSIPGYARVVRASILSIKEQEYIEAARSIGGNDFRIILKHILPNCLAPIIVQATMSIANAILSAASLSFIGLGITPPTPEWGSMLSSGRAYIRDYWHIVFFPGLMIMITVFTFNIVGDGLRDALDPRLKN